MNIEQSRRGRKDGLRDSGGLGTTGAPLRLDSLILGTFRQCGWCFSVFMFSDLVSI